MEDIYFAFPRVNECPLEIFSVKLRYLVELVTKQLCQNFNAIIQGSLFVKIWQNIPTFCVVSKFYVRYLTNNTITLKCLGLLLILI